MSYETTGASRRNLMFGVAAAAAGAGILAMASPIEASAASSKTPSNAKLTANTIRAKDGTVLYYKDWGKGPAVVFSHVYPLSSDA